ncbi:lysine--tRNA ligase [bacterium]|nr:lysine--tRNA ligase [bacterium]
MTEDVNLLILQRKDKLKELYDKGINPFPHKFKGKCKSVDINEEFKSLNNGEEVDKKVSFAGRMISRRVMGKVSFSHLKDGWGKVQIYVGKNDIGEENYLFYKKMDIGDFVGVEGKVFKTRTGEISIHVEKMILLSKSLRILPEKWHGLKDTEIRYRQRYVDLIMNDKVKEIFIIRSRIIKIIRQFLDKKEFLEVETPMMQSIVGGAAAQPFITHHNALSMDLFLRVAPELYLKRLIVGGIERVYELNKNFRNEGISTRHNPEFTMLEIYQSYSDYNEMMEICEEMIVGISKEIFGKLEIEYKGNKIDLTPPWKRKGFFELLQENTGIDFSEKTDIADKSQIMQIADKLKVKYDTNTKSHKILDHIFDTFVVPKLVQPVFITDYPKCLSPLAKSKENNPEIVERFELFIGNFELANAYSELNDPVEQRKRMTEQMKAKQKGDQEAQMLDEDYIRALEYGMPPCGGLGIGIDRLVMLLTGSNSIREVILFPQMKKE